MCVVSFVGDHFQQKPWPGVSPYVFPPSETTSKTIITLKPDITREEFDALKKQVDEMVDLMRKAKAYDERNNEPNCEMEDKIKLLRQISALVGVNLDDVLKSKTNE